MSTEKKGKTKDERDAARWRWWSRYYNGSDEDMDVLNRIRPHGGGADFDRAVDQQMKKHPTERRKNRETK